VLSSEYYCVIINEEKDGKEENKYSYKITNCFSTFLLEKFCPIKPIYYSMNNEFLSISDKDYIYVLQYKGYSKQNLDGNNQEKNRK
jgi:hypothetical protein